MRLLDVVPAALPARTAARHAGGGSPRWRRNQPPPPGGREPGLVLERGGARWRWPTGPARCSTRHAHGRARSRCTGQRSFADARGSAAAPLRTRSSNPVGAPAGHAGAAISTARTSSSCAPARNRPARCSTCPSAPTSRYRFAREAEASVAEQQRIEDFERRPVRNLPPAIPLDRTPRALRPTSQQATPTCSPASPWTSSCSRSSSWGGDAVPPHAEVALIGAAAITLYQWCSPGSRPAPAGPPGRAPEPRMGHAGQCSACCSACAARRPLREEPPARGAAEPFARRLEGRLLLLAGVFVMSAFLDNIAAAMIGGTMAKVLFRRKVHRPPRRHRRGEQCRRRQQRGRRHDHDDDLDRWRQLTGRARGLCRRPARAAHLRHAGRQAAGRLDQPISATTRPACTSSTPARDRDHHPRHGDRGQRLVQRHQPAVLDHFPVIGCAVVLALLATAPLRAPQWSLLPGAFRAASSCSRSSGAHR